jgi:hypothetical protein
MACKGSGVRIPVPPPSEALITEVFISLAQLHKMGLCAVNFSNAFSNAIAEVVADLVG